MPNSTKSARVVRSGAIIIPKGVSLSEYHRTTAESLYHTVCITKHNGRLAAIIAWGCRLRDLLQITVPSTMSEYIDH